MKSKIIFLVVLLIFLVSCAQQEHIVEQASQNQVKNVDVLKNGDTSGITTENVNYFENSFGFLAKPKKEGIYPAVIMIHEWWGLNDNIKEMTRSLAAEGYVVLAVDMFGKVAKDANEARALSTEVRNNPGKAIQNLKSAVEYLKSQKIDEVTEEEVMNVAKKYFVEKGLNLALIGNFSNKEKFEKLLKL